MSPLGRFVRARLRRRIFAWFASGILTTAIVVTGVMMLVARTQQSSLDSTMHGGLAWVGRQFARDWDDPARREAFARETAEELQVELALLDEQGRSLLTLGSACGHRAMEAPVMRGATRLGTVQACFRHPPGWGWRWLLGVGLAVALLWGASGRVARRLARPLDELTTVVKRIGAGDLKARAEISCAQPDEIGVVAEAVNDMAARIEKQVDDQRELLATVSHELRTPLARVRVVTEIGRESGATAKTWDDLDLEVEEMDALVGELLASSRLDFGQLSVRELSKKDLVLQALERAGVDPSKAHLEGEDRVRGDPTLLLRALANLLDNAKKHGGGVDAVRAVAAAGRVSFEVLDRGPGLPGGGGEALFERFKRRVGGGDGDGLGLGLGLVQRIAAAHGGTAWAKDREGQGASVGFEVAAG